MTDELHRVCAICYHPLDRCSHCDSPKPSATVDEARQAYTKARTEWYELAAHADSADVLLFYAEMEIALDALIAAVRADTVREDQ